MVNPQTQKKLKEAKRQGILETAEERDEYKTAMTESQREDRLQSVNTKLQNPNIITPPDLSAVALQHIVTADMIPNMLSKGSALPLARLVFFRNLDHIHTFDMPSSDNARATYFALSTTSRAGKSLSVL